MQRRARLALMLVAGAAATLTLPLAAKDPLPAPKPRSDVVWAGAGDDSFGGFSAVEISADGTRLVALSDAGAFVSAHVARTATGAITAITADGPVTALRGPGGKPLRDADNDSEGLAIRSDGTAYVSFEGSARVMRYPGLDGVPTVLPVPAEFRAMQKNSSLEALAIAPDGTLYTMPERSGRIDLDFPVFRFRGGKWDQPFALRRDGTLLPVGADVGPDGRLYVVEREFLGLAGFHMRLRSFRIGATALTDERILVETPTGRHGNLEGVSIWRDKADHLIATLIADNNYRWYLPTEVVEYDLGPTGAGAGPTG